MAIPRHLWKLPAGAMLVTALGFSLSSHMFSPARLPASGQDHFEKALRLYCENHMEQALKEVDRAIALDPDNSAAFHARGNIRYELCQYGLAVADYTRAIELNPRDASAFSNRGWSYRRLGKEELAFHDWINCNKILGPAASNLLPSAEPVKERSQPATAQPGRLEQRSKIRLKIARL